MKSSIFKFAVVGLGFAIFTACIFIFISQQPKESSPSTVVPENNVSTSTISSPDNALASTTETSETEQVPANEIKSVAPQAPKVTSATPSIPPEHAPAPAETSNDTQQTDYDYPAMRSFADKLDGFLADDGRANQTFVSSQKAGNSGNYGLAVTYAEDALAIYDSLIERNRELEIPQITPPEVKTVMQQSLQVHLTHINNFRKPLQIHLTMMKELEDDKLASQSTIESYEDAMEMSQEAFKYTLTVFLPKLAELNASVEKYKPN